MIAVTGGGTGGHIFPILAVIEELRRIGEKGIVWIGHRGGSEEEWAKRLNVPFYGIYTGKLRRYFSLKNLLDLLHVVLGTFQALFILKKLKPAVLFSKGGFVSVPPAVAAWILGIPIVSHESDISPGLATRFIARFSSAICVSFERTADYFPSKRVIHTGNPVRSVIKKGNARRGVRGLGFNEPLPIVTVLGGSMGSRSINRAVNEMLSSFELPFNLVHQCGRGNATGGSPTSRYREIEFLEEDVGDVLAASDLIVSRAGAGALHEIGYLKKPSILIPLSRGASRGEQISNARFFEENGAAVVLESERLNTRSLYEQILSLLGDRKRLSSMGERAASLCRRDAENKITGIIVNVVKQKRNT